MTLQAIVRASVECPPENLERMLARYRAERWSIESVHREPVWVSDRFVVGFDALRSE